MRKPFLIMLACWVGVGLNGQGLPPHSLPRAVNTEFEEFRFVMSAEGDALFLARHGHPNNRGEAPSSDIWVTYKTGPEQWSKPLNIGAPVNSTGSEWPAGLNPSENELYVYAAAQGQLLRYKREGRFWRSPTPQHIQNWVPSGGPAFFQVSHDGRHLFSVTPQTGRRQGQDIYLSTREGAEEWGPPVPLPATVNGPADEYSCFLAPDNRTLYFSSDRPGGFGGYDLYLSRRQGEGWLSWSEPVNLGSGVNSPADELSISLSAAGETAYLVRRPVAKDRNLIAVSLPDSLRPKPLVLVKGKVNLSRPSLAGEVEVRLENAKAGRVVQVAEVGPDGQYCLLAPAGEAASLYAELPGYFVPATPLYPGAGAEPPLSATAAAGTAAFAETETPEIQHLHLHLQHIDEELLSLQEARQQALRELKAKRLKLDLPPPSDPEIEALRHRYRFFTLAENRQDTFPDDGYDEAAAAERELEDMQVRFKRYYAHEKSKQHADSVREQGDRHLWETAPTFEELQAQAQQELQAELIPELEGRLVEEAEVAVKVPESEALTESERARLQQKATQLQDQIRAGLASSSPVRGQWAAKGGAVAGQNGREDWEEEVLEDMKAVLRDDVASALEDELAAEVKGLMQVDAAYQVKKLEQAAVQEKLDRKISQQLAIEQEFRASEEAERIAPLVPPPGPKPRRYEEIQKDLELVAPELGQSILLQNVQFEPGTDRLQPVAYSELNRMLAFLQQHPALVVEVGAHAGEAMSYAQALSLTEKRARVVTNFFLGNGIPAARLKAKGFGKAFPKPNGQASERLEMRIIGKR